MRVVYGIEVSRSDHVYDILIEESGIAVSRAGVPCSFLVDLIPIRDLSILVRKACSYHLLSEIHIILGSRC